MSEAEQSPAPAANTGGPQSAPQERAPAAAAGGIGGRQVYQAGGGRRLLFSVIFLLLLPFWASLPAMLYQRLSAGLWFDTAGLAVLAAGFTLIMVLVVFELMYSVRARIELGDRALRSTLPAARAGMPKFVYRKRELPYSEIAAVETRREIYGGSLAPVLLYGARLVTRGGDKIALGYVNEASPDRIFPLPEIAAEVARRAGVEAIHRGNVRREVRRKWLGMKAGDDPGGGIPEAEIAALNQRHGRVVLAICSVLVVLVAIGLARDLLTTTLDAGERGADFTATKSSAEAQKAKAGAKAPQPKAPPK